MYPGNSRSFNLITRDSKNINLGGGSYIVNRLKLKISMRRVVTRSSAGSERLKRVKGHLNVSPPIMVATDGGAVRGSKDKQEVLRTLRTCVRKGVDMFCMFQYHHPQP